MTACRLIALLLSQVVCSAIHTTVVRRPVVHAVRLAPTLILREGGEDNQGATADATDTSNVILVCTSAAVTTERQIHPECTFCQGSELLLCSFNCPKYRKCVSHAPSAKWLCKFMSNMPVDLPTKAEQAELAKLDDEALNKDAAIRYAKRRIKVLRGHVEMSRKGLLCTYKSLGTEEKPNNKTYECA